MKAITIQQPWAWAIIAGHKRVENRTWPTRHRGPLAIHAGLSRASEKEGRRVLAELGIEVPEDLVYGAVVGIVDVVDCVSLTNTQILLFETRLAQNLVLTSPWCWLLENPRPLAPSIPRHGRQGIWNETALPPDCSPTEG